MIVHTAHFSRGDHGRRSFTRLLAVALTLVALSAVAQAQKDIASPDDLPLFDLAEHEVVYSETDFTPRFKYETPQFTYYETPELPRGELILALDFMDRYRENLVPGEHKWAGLLHFPVIDGYERKHLKWICLYFYNDQMYGYDPSAKMESERRFIVPIRYDDRETRSVLFQFAESYVESVYPETDDYYYEYDQGVGSDGGGFDSAGDLGGDLTGAEYYDDGGLDSLEMITIPAGRIGPVLPSHRDRNPEDLVNLVYRFSEAPNPGQFSDSTMGPDEDFGKRKGKFSWENLGKELVGYSTSDYIRIAQMLVSPRGSIKVVFHHKKNILLWKVEARASAMVFNIGNRLYAYSPKYGVWRTNAKLEDMKDIKALEAGLGYPGIDDVERIEFITNAQQQAEQGS